MTHILNANWKPEEREAIKNLALEHRVSEMVVVRQALRFYQFHNERLKAGETCTYSGDVQRAREFAGSVLPPEPSHSATIRDAMQDLLCEPKGSVPKSASKFYDTRRGRFSTRLVSDFLDP
jgi:hypothetical protein